MYVSQKSVLKKAPGADKRPACCETRYSILQRQIILCIYKDFERARFHKPMLGSPHGRTALTQKLTLLLFGLLLLALK